MSPEQVEAALHKWQQFLFNQEPIMNAEGWDEDDLCKAEENHAGWIEFQWTDADRQLIQEAAQKKIEGKPPIDPEDESHDREQRFYTFIAVGRLGDMYLL